jgi:hypothetical protein
MNRNGLSPPSALILSRSVPTTCSEAQRPEHTTRIVKCESYSPALVVVITETTSYEHVLPVWRADRAAGQPFKLSMRVRYRPQQICYRPGFWQELKFGWVQYVSAQSRIFLFFFFFFFFKRALLCARIPFKRAVTSHSVHVARALSLSRPSYLPHSRYLCHALPLFVFAFLKRRIPRAHASSRVCLGT